MLEKNRLYLEMVRIMRDKLLWSTLADELEHNKRVVLCTVVDSQGSSPGKLGFKLIVSKTGFWGTIGGGIFESKVIQFAREKLIGDFKPLFKTYYHHRNADLQNQSGLICSGSQTILFLQMQPSDISKIQVILDAYATKTPNQLVVFEDSFVIDSAALQSSQPVIYSEEVANPNTAYVFGGGHVGSAITNQLRQLNFYVIQFDDRDDLDRLQLVRSPHELIIGPYSEVKKHIQQGNRSFVIVTTAALEKDIEVLNSILPGNYKYVGLMGSKSKLAKIANALPEHIGFERVYRPIGLDIGARTPEEIAVSIAAEIISIQYS